MFLVSCVVRLHIGAERKRPKRRLNYPSPAASCGRPSRRLTGISTIRGRVKYSAGKTVGEGSVSSWKRNDPLGTRAAFVRSAGDAVNAQRCLGFDPRGTFTFSLHQTRANTRVHFKAMPRG